MALAMLLGLWACGGEAQAPGSDDTMTSFDIPSYQDSQDATPGEGLNPGDWTFLDHQAGDGTPDGPPEAVTPIEGQFGAPCSGNEQCDASYCVPTANGQVCTTYCVDSCSAGWTCKLISNDATDVTYICVPHPRDPLRSLPQAQRLLEPADRRGKLLYRPGRRGQVLRRHLRVRRLPERIQL